MEGSKSSEISCPYCEAPMEFDRGVYKCAECGYEAVKPTHEVNLKLACERAGIPRRYLDVDAEGAPELEREGKGLYIQGGNGTLKTTLAMAIAKKCVADGWKVRVTSGLSILAKLRGADRADADLLAEELAAPDLLVLDDLGKENPTEWVVSTLFQIVNERYNSMRTTVVTSNYTKQQLAERYTVDGDSSTAESIVSRLFDMTSKLECDGGDRRLA